jgi:hypothetical protein
MKMLYVAREEEFFFETYSNLKTSEKVFYLLQPTLAVQKILRIRGLNATARRAAEGERQPPEGRLRKKGDRGKGKDPNDQFLRSLDFMYCYFKYINSKSNPSFCSFRASSSRPSKTCFS